MKKLSLIFALFLPFDAFATETQGYTNIPGNVAHIRALNKKTGRTRDLTIQVGNRQMFEGLSVEVKACYFRPENETPENSMFAIVGETYDNSHRIKGKPVFSGWLFSEAASLSTVDHPDYDIWLLSCENDTKLPAFEVIKIDSHSGPSDEGDEPQADGHEEPEDAHDAEA